MLRIDQVLPERAATAIEKSTGWRLVRNIKDFASIGKVPAVGSKYCLKLERAYHQHMLENAQIQGAWYLVDAEEKYKNGVRTVGEALTKMGCTTMPDSESCPREFSNWLRTHSWE